MKRVTLILIMAFGYHSGLLAQLAKSYHLSSGNPTTSLPPSNSSSDILVLQDTVWFGTDKGLSRTTDAGTSFSNLGNVAPFNAEGISAIAANDQVIWVATATTYNQNGQSLPQGSGLEYSTDRGLTWQFVPQPVDSGLVDTIQYGINRIKSIDVTTTVDNITYNIALTRTAVWTASFAGMLRKSTDRGKTWTRVILPPDSLDSISPDDTLQFDLCPVDHIFPNDTLTGNYNHRVFSVIATDDSTLWVGTADGINKSTDGGTSWQKFSHQNQLQPISGDFVVAIKEQQWGTHRIVWAATVNANGSDEQRGVSYSSDGGTTWTTTLLGEFAHNIAFQDSITYVVTDDGMFRSSDYGNTWIKSGTVLDQTNDQRFASSELYAVAIQGDTVWTAGPDGIAYTVDSPGSPFGSVWRVFRTYVPVGSSPKTYSYPLPFSPNQEVVRIHYGTRSQDAPVTIRIFDFGMNPVKTLLRDAVRPANSEQDEIWDGIDGHGRRVANGVYFYSVTIGSLPPGWGKILVIQ